jgi:hypothetical protein
MPVTQCERCGAVIDYDFEDISKLEAYKVRMPCDDYPKVKLCMNCKGIERGNENDTIRRGRI